MTAYDPAAGLDGLRGLAAMTVAFGHGVSAAFFGSHVWLAICFGVWARAAVVFFFVLSGYVIANSIRRSFAAGEFSLARFALNRITRVYPPFLLALALAWTVALLRRSDVIAPVQPFIAEPMATTTAAFLRDLVFLFGAGTPMQNANAPVWSLRIEVICYAVAGIAALALKATPVWRGLCVGFALLLMALTLLRLDSALLGMAAFAAGSAAALLPAPGVRRFAGFAFTVVVVIGAWLCLQLAVGGDPVALLTGRSYLIFQIVAVAASALLVMAIVHRDAPSPAWPARWSRLAPFSYTLFITHVPLIALIVGFAGLPASVAGKAVFVLGLVFASIVFAALAARIVERHADLRRWLASRPPVSAVLAWEARR
jgi:peptidoglycan/LPS O-acetylase OafA/YrhL